MTGVELDAGRRSLPVVSIFLAVLSVVFLIWSGPTGAYFSSTIGLIAAVLAIARVRHLPAFARHNGVALILLPIHVLLLLTGLTLQMLFLTPLSANASRLPKFRHVYEDPEGLFRLRGPAGWDYTRMVMGSETGVRIRPIGREAYMGISELNVLVRRLDAAPASPQALLDRMAAAIVEGRKKNGKGLFEFNVTPATLLDGAKGLWAMLDVKRFWVPLHQVSLLGIKEKRYLCSVSATGLKSHARLSNVVCLGTFETIQFGDANQKQSLKKR